MPNNFLILFPDTIIVVPSR